jgi:tetratricopeptide (TPR) repeat protein
MKIEIKNSYRLAPSHLKISKSHSKKWLLVYCLIIPIAFFFLAETRSATAQEGFAIWGEIKIDAGTGDSQVPSAVNVILVRVGTGELGRQSISSRGRYRFTNLQAGDYEVVIEVDEKEITRARIQIFPDSLSPFYGFRQDFEFTWNAGSSASHAAVISAADAYTRSAANQALFHKAQNQAAKKQYDQATALLREILDNDKADFQVWTLLGTVYLAQEKSADAEKAYLSAITAKPTFAMALVDLARLRSAQKRFAEVIDPLTRAIELQPESAEANLMLGEAYLQVKKGSKAIGYLEEAARLGRMEGYLRLAWLYDAAGMKDKAAAEYEELLKKNPDYPDRKKMERYITANKKSNKAS